MVDERQETGRGGGRFSRRRFGAKPIQQEQPLPPLAPPEFQPIQDRLLPTLGPERYFDMAIDIPQEGGTFAQGRLRPDNTVWLNEKQVGTLDPSTGQVSPIEVSAWDRAAATGLNVALTGVEWFFKPFELFEDYVGKSFATAVTAPFWQKTWWANKSEEEKRALMASGAGGDITLGTTPWEFFKNFMPEGEFRKAYHEMEAPKYVRGAIEFIPWFVVPPVARIAAWIGRGGKAGRIAAKVLIPYVAMEKATVKLIEIPIKQGAKVVRRILRPDKINLAPLRPIKEVTDFMAANHPERLSKGNYVEADLMSAELLKRADEMTRDSGVETVMSTLGYIGRAADLFKLKAMKIPGTNYTHELVTARYITPKKPGASMAHGDILGNPDAYNWLGAKGQEARQWAKMYGEFADAGKALREQYSLKTINELGFEEGGRYVPWRVVGEFDEAGKLIFETTLFPGGALPGATPSFGKQRKFATQLAGIRAGKKYAPATDTMEAYLKANYNVAIGERAIQLIDKYTKSPSELLDAGIKQRRLDLKEEVDGLKALVSVIERVKGGDTLRGSPGLLSRISRMSPDAAKVLGEAIDKKYQKLPEALKRISDLEARLAREIEAKSQFPITSQVGSAKTLAIGADPAKKYSFNFEVVEANLPIASHTTAFTPNPKFPKELQPRLRANQLNREQVEKIARDLDPDALLVDSHRLDSGAMILGADNVVESGSGRMIAILKAIEQYPERFAAYRKRLEDMAEVYGLDRAKIAAMKSPVLIRRRTSQVDRAAFVREANESVAAQMSLVELAFADAVYLSDEGLGRLTIEGTDSLLAALRDIRNSDFIARFMQNIPMSERAGFIGLDGSLSKQGLDRISNAILAKAYPGEFGLKLAQMNIEALTPDSKLIIAALAGSAGDIAKLGSFITRGVTGEEFHIAQDLAIAAERYLRNRAMGLPLESAFQSTLFEGGATPMQQALIRMLDTNKRSATKIRDIIRQYTDEAITQTAPGQGAMPGFAPEVLSREGIMGRILGETIPESVVTKPPVAPAAAAAAVPEPKAPAPGEPPVAPVPEPKPGAPGAPTEPLFPAEGTPEYASWLKSLNEEEFARAGQGTAFGYEYDLTMGRLEQQVRDKLKLAQANFKVAGAEYKIAKQDALSIALSEGRVPQIPAWSNKIFGDALDAEGNVLMSGREMADRVQKIFIPEDVVKALRYASNAARLGVTVKAALDLSWIFIQGSLVLGHDVSMWARGRYSDSWVRGTKAMLKTMFNPKFAGEFDAKFSAIARDAASHGVILEREAEFISAGTLEKVIRQGLARIPGASNFAGTIIRQTYGRAGAGFSTGGKVARLTMWDSMRNTWVKEGGNLAELGELVNKLTGVISSKELGVGASRRAFESAALFAPRYTRAYLMLVRDLLRGNMTSAEARKSLSGMMVGGLAAYVALGAAIGQEPKLNPAPKKLGGDGAEFMSFRIGNSIIGLPGFWYSAVRMMTMVNAAAEHDPEALISVNWRENPGLRFMMSRTSPLVRLMDDIVSGKDFLGNNLNSADKWMANIGEYFLTIAAQNLVTRRQGDEEGKFDRFAAELLGLRTYPQSEWTKLKDMRTEYAVADFGKDYTELNLEEKDKLKETHKDYALKMDEARDRMVMEKGEDYEMWLLAGREQADAMYNAAMEDASLGLVQGVIAYKTFLDTAEFLRRVYRGQKWMSQYISDLSDPEGAEEFQAYLRDEQMEEDKALGAYLNIYGTPTLVGGAPDWALTERRADQFLSSLSAEVRQYVLRNKARWTLKLPPQSRLLMQIQVNGREKIRGYYSKEQGVSRIEYRRQYPDVDAWLILMGRVQRPVSDAGLDRLIELAQQHGLPMTMFPKAGQPAQRRGARGRFSQRRQP